MKNTLLVAALTLLSLLAGCSANKDTPRQQVHAQWNNARAGVLYGLAKQQVESANLAEARKSLDEALTLQPDSVSIHLLSSRVRIEQGQLDAAIDELNLSLKIDPNCAEAAYLMGVVMQRWEKPADALKWYAQAAEKNAAEPAYVLARAETLVAMDQTRKALDYLQERMAYFETSAPIRDAIGQIMISIGQYAQALPILRQAMILAQDEPLYAEHYALALYYAGQFRDSLALLDRINSAKSDAPRADLLLAQAQCLLSLDRPRDARDILQDLAINYPSNSSIWLALAQSHLACEDPDRAELSLNKALALDPASSQAILMRGYLRLSQGRLDDALNAFSKAAEFAADDPMPLTLVGYVLELKGESRTAMEMYAKALKISPKDALASRLLASLQP
jgi:tetratricopeptide (TPR) repeat protein